ncbi:hypothetical protein ACTHSI_00600 [Neisseria sp. P0001.S004]|uniref:hypothetical protein n=1 Tax=Neisseria sp. P0001.S005 TaxID=3436649 RepID=UPI003F8062EF
METKKSIRQHLSQMLRKLKPATPRKQVMVATGFFVEETEEACKTELDRVKKHIKPLSTIKLPTSLKTSKCQKKKQRKSRLNTLNSELTA